MTESASSSTSELIADLIMSAPGWVRVGITAPSRRVRLESVSNLADHVAQAYPGKGTQTAISYPCLFERPYRCLLLGNLWGDP
ncbi:DUF6771 family protein [Novosphingobium silvae]|uniref:DUF6771 family protein n=1 Tax=Novosphingobium silvae TaxID=2692619 RepID=UPI003B026726